MCGIAGFLDTDGRRSPDRLREIVEAMNEQMIHRGPDDHGTWVDPSGRCALAQRRLSILDLSSQGRQPMVDESGEVGITFNGEIYNFADLREDLESQGCRFKSRTDTEVLLHLMGEQATDHLSALRGMFAFGLWNARKRRLLLARDPLGKKPLYVAQGNGWFAFASELRALEVIEELDRTITPEALSDYFLVQYFHSPGTIYRGVEKVGPGCFMSVDVDGHVDRSRYFRFDAGAPVPGVRLAPTYEGRVEQLASLIERAVRRRLISDVPLGAFLSGGVDSALIVAMMRRAGVGIRTFSVGFEDSPDSEHVYARQIADRLGTEHDEIIVRPDAIELCSSIAERLDEPNGDSSCLPTYLLSEFTRRHVTVALSGDGGDEMFGGYGRYLDVARESVSPSRPESWTASEAYLGPRWTIFQPGQIRAFLGHLPQRCTDLLDRWGSMLDRSDRPVVHGMRNVDVESYLPGSVLAKVDRMSMQHSLEVRCPLLDVDVARFAAALSADDLLGRSIQANGESVFTGKRILRDILARDLPRAWVERKKVGFGLPEAFWDAASLRDFAHDVLDGPSTLLCGLVDRSALGAWLGTQRDSDLFSIYRLWPMLVLELWLRARHVKPVPVEARTAILL